MEKKEYMKRRLLRDTIQLCILNPKAAAAGDSGESKLFADLKKILTECVNAASAKAAGVEAVIDKRLRRSLYDKKGGMVNVLPDDLDLSCVNDTRKLALEYAAGLLDADDAAAAVSAIASAIELRCWQDGVKNAADELRAAVADLNAYCKDYCNNFSYPDNCWIKERYAEAREITLVERIKRSNHKDIEQYVKSLKRYLLATCQIDVLKFFAKKAFGLMDDPRIAAIQAQLDKTVLSAARAAAALDDEPDWQWANDYETMFPVEFFERNLPLVSGKMAFTMMFLRLLASNEAWLRQKGFINAEGVFRLLTNPDANGDAMEEIETIINVYCDSCFAD